MAERLDEKEGLLFERFSRIMEILRKRKAVLWCVGCLVVLAVSLLTAFGFLEGLEVKVMDLFFRMRPVSTRVCQEIVVVEVTDWCIERIGAWPWPRSQMAELVRRLCRAGAVVIGLDFLYDDASFDPGEDEVFAEALREAGCVVLPCEIKSRRLVGEYVGELAGDFEVRYPIECLRKAARAVGFVNVDVTYDNVDGIIRKLPVAKRIGKRYIPSLSLAMASVYLDAPPVYLPDGSIGFRGYDYLIPTYPSRRWVHDELLEKRTPRFELSTYLNYDPLALDGNFVTVPASEVLKADSPDMLKRMCRGRAVLVGANISGVDVKLTPFKPMPGVMLQATLLRNILERNFLRRIPSWTTMAVIVLLGGALTWLFMRVGLASALVLYAVVCGGWMGLSYLAFSRLGWIVDVVPLLVLSTVLLAVLKLADLSFSLSRKIFNLEFLNEYGRLFSSELDLERLKEIVSESFGRLTSAKGLLLATQGTVPEAMELSVYGDVPDEYLVRLGSKKNRQLVKELLQERLAPVPAAEVMSKVEPPLDEPGAGGDVLVPLLYHDGVYGWLFLHDSLLRLDECDEGEISFWLALGNYARTSIENARLYKLATVDSLTSLYVRHFFDINIEREFNRVKRYGGHLSLLVTDVDHFKKFNDTYGHQMGDRVLRLVAQAVKGCVRHVDVPARYGGEEFAIILPEADGEAAVMIAERIRGKIEQIVIQHRSATVGVTVSIGVSSFSHSSASSPKEFIREADEALYAAKESGRNRVCTWWEHCASVAVPDEEAGGGREGADASQEGGTADD